MPSGEILINQLFAGGYLSEGSNIGHEVINLFDSDAGVRYLYVTPSGKVGNHEVESIIFVRNVKARTTVEVIAIASCLSPVEEEEISRIEYGGVLLEHIFRGNTYHGGEDVFSGVVTYRAERVLVPAVNTRVLITVDDEFDLSSWPNSVLLKTGKKVVVSRGLRTYFSEVIDFEAYEQLNELIANEFIWEEADSSDKLITDGAVRDQTTTFLEIIGKEDDELAFSNLLAYYFDYNHAAFMEFAASEELLSIPDMDADFSVTRELNHNVDLWIEDSRHIIVIENKIRSGINGGGDDGWSQLEKYRTKAQTQAERTEKSAHFYAFVPDYSRIDFKRFDPDGVYKVVPYSAIHRFFEQHVTSYISDRFFPDFLRGLERQSLTMSELSYRTMRSRFLRKIAAAQ